MQSLAHLLAARLELTALVEETERGAAEPLRCAGGASICERGCDEEVEEKLKGIEEEEEGVGGRDGREEKRGVRMLLLQQPA
eukprot:828835-Rhodomonas_salina.5